ncbi:MAG: hypothetical protein FJY67_09750 [Calditrichaeota bacterium]|nr:hypothetical protein [Calditrichota bacterium]
MRYLFIINTRSGTPKFVTRLQYLIRRHFGPEGRHIQVVRSLNAEHILTLARDGAAKDLDAVVAVGGDGTVNLTAQALSGTDTALGVIPTGSGNGFARNVGIPLRIERALELLHDPVIEPIDVGVVGERIFLVSCGIGWEAVVATVFDQSRFRGVLPYASAALATYLQYEPQEITLTAEPGGWNYRGRPMLFSITNMREYGVGVTIAPQASERDGMLDICIVPRHGLVDLIKMTPELFRMRLDAIPGYVHRRAGTIHIERTYPGNIHLDGTPFPSSESFEVSIRPGALKTITRRDTRPRKLE